MAPGRIATNGEDLALNPPSLPGQESQTAELEARDATMHVTEPHPLDGHVLNSDGSDTEAPLLTGHVTNGNGIPTPLHGLNGNGSHTPPSSNGSATPLNGSTTPTTPIIETATPVNGSTNGASNGPSTGPTPLPPMPIAIIGLSVRAGSASTPDEFFEMLSRSRSAFHSSFPANRFNNASFYHPNAGKPGCINTNGASFISGDVSKFDAPFFSITELEATSMDPQQRLLLECAFEALESAGVRKGDVVGEEVGVFVGAGSPEYEVDLFRDSDTMPMFQATGNHLAMQSNKISHFFDWRGPSLTIDTACSSSLTALHYACQSLRTSESSLALAGGINLNLIPEFFINYSTSRLLGNDGRSFSFDARGTGYGRGEGCGMVLLKPLDQAIRDNDAIRAVIAASGVNQDGWTPGITMPNGSSQETLIRSIYANANLDPTLTGYVEAHGTGTRVGDPIEVTALRNVFSKGRTARNPLYIGSVKSNIGHLESASGILAVIKAAVMLDRGFILPNYDFKVGNPKIPFKEWGLKVPTRQLPWPRGKKYASINNFGFGGTNAHVVMERAPIQTRNDDPTGQVVKEDPTKKLFVLSAADKAACQALMQNLGVYLEQRPEMFQRDLMSNVAYTLGQRRSLLAWRVAIPATESFDLVEKLSKGTIAPVKETGRPRIGFVCTGQGAQWWAMGRELYERYAVFTEVIDQTSAILTKLGSPYTLLEELSLDEKTTRVNQAHISQPACTAIQLALIALLRSWNITPTAVIGHSSGEIAAAYAAGILTIESAMRIAYHRGRLVPVLKERYPDLQGSMMAVGCGKPDIEPLISQLQNREARVACYNSPESLTISGDTPAIAELAAALEDRQVFNRKLVIETAYHSHHMELIAGDYFTSLRSLPAPQPAREGVAFFSSLTGKEARDSELDSSYWVRNLTSPVKFAQALAHLASAHGDFSTGVDLIVEIGPHCALQGPVKQTLRSLGGAAEKIPYAATLARKKDAVDTMLDLASTLFCKGAPLDLATLNFAKALKTPTLLVDLPAYPWNHSKSYWHESRIAKVHKSRPNPRHDILGTLANYSNELEPTWRNMVRLDDLPWLRHHKIQSLTIFPISGFVGMVVEAAFQQARTKDIEVGSVELRNLNVHTPLMLPDESVEMTITLRSPQAADVAVETMTSAFLIHSYSANKGWTENCSGTVVVKTEKLNEVDGEQELQRQNALLAEAKARIEKIDTAVPQNKIYDALAELGVQYGSTFQGLTDCRADDNHAVATITVADTAAEMPEHFETPHIVHPSFLEQLIQMYWPVLGAGRAALDTVCLPSSISKLTVSAKILEHARTPGQTLRAYSTAPKPLSTQKPSKVSMFAVADGQSEALLSISDLSIAPLPSTEDAGNEQTARELCYKQIWEPILSPLDTDFEIRVDSPQTNGTSLPSSPISIVHGPSPSQLTLARHLATTLESLTGAKVDLGALEEINPTNKNIICITELESHILANLSHQQFHALQSLIQAASSLLWLTRGAYGQGKNSDPVSNLVSGFSRAIRSESMFKFAHLDLDSETRLPDEGIVAAAIKVFTSVVNAKSVEGEEMEFQERKGAFWTPRIVEDEVVNAYVHKRSHPPDVEESEFGKDERKLKLGIKTPGVLDELFFEDDDTPEEGLGEMDVEIKVGAVGLNGRDVLLATGTLESEDGAASASFGQECAGTVTRVGKAVTAFVPGDRIAALTPIASSISTLTQTSSSLALKLPSSLSFSDAANLPLAQCAAHYSLLDIARLEDGENVLVINAASPTGQAALSLAQSVGANLFATVESAEDKKVLEAEYDIPCSNIFSTSSSSLPEALLRATKGHGIDILLALHASPDAIQAAVPSIADFGRIIIQYEGGVAGQTPLAISTAATNTSLHTFSLHSLAISKPRTLRHLISDVSRSLKYGKLRPIQGTTVLPISEITSAFKTLKSAPSSRIVLVPQSSAIVRVTPSKTPRLLFKADATYILIGGTGGLGRGMTRWMAEKGARHIVLLSRSGKVEGVVKTLVEDMAEKGVEVVVRSCDVADKASVEELLKRGLAGLPKIRGVIHGAMVLRDKLFDTMLPADYHDVISSKLHGTLNFSSLLLSPSSPFYTTLDFFTLFSSSAAAMGGRGQTAYAAANSFLDAFAQFLRHSHFPGKAASLGPTAVLDAGFLFENSEMMNDVIRNIGDNHISEAEVLSLLESTLDGTSEKSCDGHIITGVHLDPQKIQFWGSDAKYKHLRARAEEIAAQTAGASGAKQISWSAAFRNSQSLEEAEGVVTAGLVDKIASILGLERDEVDPNRNLSNYALDSLTAIDVRNFITREFEASLQVLELLASGTVAGLGRQVVAKSRVVKGWEGK